MIFFVLRVPSGSLVGDSGEKADRVLINPRSPFTKTSLNYFCDPEVQRDKWGKMGMI